MLWHIKYLVNMMPGFDGTGPRGLGPMTGRGMGLCTGYMSTPYPTYGFRQPIIPRSQNINPNLTQNPYRPQTYGVPYQYPQQTLLPPASPQRLPMMPIQNPYPGSYPFGIGMGRGFGLGIRYRRGMGWNNRGTYRY